MMKNKYEHMICHPDQREGSLDRIKDYSVTACSMTFDRLIQHHSSQAVVLSATSPRFTPGFPLQSLTRAFVSPKTFVL